MSTSYDSFEEPTNNSPLVTRTETTQQVEHTLIPTYLFVASN